MKIIWQHIECLTDRLFSSKFYLHLLLAPVAAGSILLILDAIWSEPMLMAGAMVFLITSAALTLFLSLTLLVSSLRRRA